MQPQDHGQSISFTNARLVLRDAVVQGGLRAEDGVIVDCGPQVTDGIDLDGDFLIPGLIDIHTDHAETHVIPRHNVRWNELSGLLAHDAVVIAAGITTVFDSLSVGATMHKPERRQILGPLVDALEAGVAAGMFRADHRLHMRCEICDPTTIELVDANIERPITGMVSVMDHTPGDRQCPDLDAWVRETARDMQISLDEASERTNALLERSAKVGSGVRAHVVAAAKARGVPILSHDDRTEAHVDEAAAEGAGVSEFPTTLAAARRARVVGQSIVAGAPNYMLGGSQSGNVAVRDLMREGLVDVLASDYVPRSMLDTAFAVAMDDELPADLPQSIDMVTGAPARLAGLEDRGEISVGKRADMVRVKPCGPVHHVAGVWRGGVQVY